MDGKGPVAEVSISNIHTSTTISTGKDGAFFIDATGDHLLEFKKAGYKTARLRVPKGNIPPFFRIIISKALPDKQIDAIAHDNRYDYRSDSMRYRELYKHELDFPKMTAIEMIKHPFSAMSGKNREIWQFQDDYEAFEKEKYVDRTFNSAIVTKFTGLTGDSLTVYMKRFKPTYEQLRAMNDYTFYSYIRYTAFRFRKPETPRGAQ
jgi:hypothetical protein